MQNPLPPVPWHIFSTDLQTLKDEANRRRTTSLAESCTTATNAINANTKAVAAGDVHKALKAENDASEALWQVFTVAADTLRGTKFSLVGIAGLGKLAAVNLMLPNQVFVTCSMLKKMFWNSAVFSPNNNNNSSSSLNSSNNFSNNQINTQDEDVHMRVAQTLCSMLCSDAAKDAGLEHALSVAMALYCSTPFPHVQAAAGAAIIQVTTPLLDFLIPPNHHLANQQQQQSDNNNNNTPKTPASNNNNAPEPHLIDGPIQKQHMLAIYLFKDCLILGGWCVSNPAIPSPMWLTGLNFSSSSAATSPVVLRAKQTLSILCLDIVLNYFSSRDSAVVNQLMQMNSVNNNNNSSFHQDPTKEMSSASSSQNSLGSASKIGTVSKQRLPHVSKIVNDVFVPVFCASVFTSSQELFSRFHRLVVAVVGQLWPLFDKKQFHILLEKNVQLILGGGGPIQMSTATNMASVSVPSTEVSWRIMSIVTQWRRVVSLVGLLPRLVQKEFYEEKIENHHLQHHDNGNHDHHAHESDFLDWQNNPLIRLLLAPARVLEAMVSSNNSNNAENNMSSSPQRSNNNNNNMKANVQNNNNTTGIIWSPELVGVLVDFTTSLCQALARWFCSSSNLTNLNNNSKNNSSQQQHQNLKRRASAASLFLQAATNEDQQQQQHLRKQSASAALVAASNNNNTNDHPQTSPTSEKISESNDNKNYNQKNPNFYFHTEIPPSSSHDIFDVVFSQLYCCFALALSRLSGEDVLHSALKAVNHLVSCACVVRHPAARDAFLILLSNELRDDLKGSGSSSNLQENEFSPTSSSNFGKDGNSGGPNNAPAKDSSSKVVNVLTERKVHILNTVVSIANGLGNELGHSWRIVIRCFLLAWDLKCESERILHKHSSNNNNNNSDSSVSNFQNKNNQNSSSQQHLDDLVQMYNLPADAILDEQELKSVAFAMDHVFESTSACFSNDAVMTLAHFLAQIPSDAEDEKGNKILPKDPLVVLDSEGEMNSEERRNRNMNNRVESPVNRMTSEDELTFNSKNSENVASSSKNKNSAALSVMNNSLPSDLSTQGIDFLSSMLLALLKSSITSPVLYNIQNNNSNAQQNQFDNEFRFVKCYWPAAKSFLIAVAKSSMFPLSVTRRTVIRFCSEVVALLGQNMNAAMDGKLNFFFSSPSSPKNSSSSIISSSFSKNNNNNIENGNHPSSASQLQLQKQKLQQRLSSFMALPLQALLELFQRSDSIFSTNNECRPPEARRLIVNEALQIVQQHGAQISSGTENNNHSNNSFSNSSSSNFSAQDSWQHLCRIAELSAQTSYVGQDSDVLTTAFRIVEMIHHGCIVQLGPLGLIKFIACVGAFIRQTVSDSNLSVNLSAVHIAWSIGDFIVSSSLEAEEFSQKQQQQQQNKNDANGEAEDEDDDNDDDDDENDFASPGSPIRGRSNQEKTPNSNQQHPNETFLLDSSIAELNQPSKKNSNNNDPRLFASTPLREVTWGSLQWDALLIQLRDGGCDFRPEIRQSALRSLFAVVGTHGSSMPPEVWSTCVWEVLLHVVERFESDIVCPLRNNGILSEENVRSKLGRKSQPPQQQQQGSSSSNNLSSLNSNTNNLSLLTFDQLSTRRPQWLEVYVSLLEGLPRVVMKFVDFISRHASNSHKVFGRLVKFGATALLSLASDHVSLAAARLLSWMLLELAPCPALLDNSDFDSLLLSLNEIGQRCQTEGPFTLNVLKTLIDAFAPTLRNLCAFANPGHHQMNVPVRLYGSVQARSARAHLAVERFISFAEMSLDAESVNTTFMFPASVQTSVLDFADAVARLLCVKRKVANNQQQQDSNTNNNNNHNCTSLAELLSVSLNNSNNNNNANTSSSYHQNNSATTSRSVASVWLSLHRLFLSRVPSADRVKEILEAAKNIMSKHIKEHPSGTNTNSSSSSSSSSNPLKDLSSFTTGQTLAKLTDRGCQPAFVANALKWLAHTFPLIENSNLHPHDEKNNNNSNFDNQQQLLPELLHIVANAIPLSCLPSEQFGGFASVGNSATIVFLTATSLCFPRMTKQQIGIANSNSSNNSSSLSAGISVMKDILNEGNNNNNNSLSSPTRERSNTQNNINNSNETVGGSKNSPNQNANNNNNNNLLLITSPGRGLANAGPLSYFDTKQNDENDENISSQNQNSYSYYFNYDLQSPSTFVPSKHAGVVKICVSLIAEVVIKSFETLKEVDSCALPHTNGSTKTKISNNKTTCQLLDFCGNMFQSLCFISQCDLSLSFSSSTANENNSKSKNIDNATEQSTASEQQTQNNNNNNPTLAKLTQNNIHLVESLVSNLLDVFVLIANTAATVSSLPPTSVTTISKNINEGQETGVNDDEEEEDQQYELIESASAQLISAWGLLDTLKNQNSSNGSLSSPTNSNNQKQQMSLDPSVVEEKVVKRTLSLIDSYCKKVERIKQLEQQATTTEKNRGFSTQNSNKSSSIVFVVDPVLVRRIVASLAAFNNASSSENNNNGNSETTTLSPKSFSEARKRLLRKISVAALPLVSVAREEEIRISVQKLFAVVLEM